MTNVKWINGVVAGLAFAGAAYAQKPEPHVFTPAAVPLTSIAPSGPKSSDIRASCFLQSTKEKETFDPDHGTKLAGCLKRADSLVALKEGRVQEAFKLMDEASKIERSLPQPAP